VDINSSSSSYQNLLTMLGKSSSATTGATASDSTAITSSASGKRSLQIGNDKVSLSLHAEKLSRINAEFFSGRMSSSDIPALAQRLYKDGFISASEYQNLGGQEDDMSTITQASNFLNTYILDEEVDGDNTAAKAILNVIDVIDRMDESITPTHRQAEIEAFDYVTAYTEQLIEKGAPESVITGFENVFDVLSALNTVRNNEQSNDATASYTSIQDA